MLSLCVVWILLFTWLWERVLKDVHPNTPSKDECCSPLEKKNYYMYSSAKTEVDIRNGVYGTNGVLKSVQIAFMS